MQKTVDEIIILQTGQIVLVEKIQMEDNSVGYSRRTINIGDTLDLETPRVQQICALVHSEEFLGTPAIPENNANWDTFNTQMMSNSRFNAVYTQCLEVAPIIANALPVALDQVTTKGYSLFTIIWGQLCSLGGATVEDKTVWGNYATENNLPTEFINILTA